MKHLVFYDGHCGLCDASVQWILARDHSKKFVFAKLQGQTAQKKQVEPDLDSVVLIENFASPLEKKPLMRSQAVFRIAYLLGGLWTIPGLFCFLPPWVFDWVYRWVAANRGRFFPKDQCRINIPRDSERFLD